MRCWKITAVWEMERKGDTATQTVRLRHLDLNALEEKLTTPIATIPTGEGEETREVFPELRELLADPRAFYTTEELPVTLHYSEGQWRILADDDLLRALAGGK